MAESIYPFANLTPEQLEKINEEYKTAATDFAASVGLTLEQAAKQFPFVHVRQVEKELDQAIKPQ